MTLKEAIIARLYPYVLPDATIELLAEDQELDLDDEYVKDDHEISCARVEISALWQLVSLEKEQDNGSLQQYNVEVLMGRIRRVAKKFGLDDELNVETPQNEDITGYW